MDARRTGSRNYVPEKVFRVSANKPTAEEMRNGEHNVSHVFQMNVRMLKMSETLSSAIRDMGDEDQVIPVANVDRLIMFYVIAFMRKHQFDAPDSELTIWDKAFFGEMGKEQMTQLVWAMDFLNVPLFSHLLVEHTTELAREKTAEQLREMFCLKKDNEDDEGAGSSGNGAGSSSNAAGSSSG